MNDTTPEAAAILDRQTRLSLTKKEVKQQLFLRFYKNDFTGKQITEILNSFPEE